MGKPLIIELEQESGGNVISIGGPGHGKGLGTDPSAFPSDTVPRPGHHRYTATGTLCPHHSRRRPCRAGRLELRSPSCPCPPPLTPSSWNSAPTVTSPG